MIDLIFRHLVESTLVCIFVGSLTYVLPRQSAAVRHSIWLISILKFFIPTLLLSATGASIAVILPATAWLSSFAPKFSALLTRLFVTWPFHVALGTGKVTFYLITIWLLGSAITCANWIRRLRAHYRGLSEPSIVERAALIRAKQRLGFRTYVGLRCSNPSQEPTLLGLFRPIITIPRGLSEEMPPAELEALLLHELAHARRLDNLAGAFAHALVCIFWFHPVLWLVERKLIAERERACDEIVIRCTTNPEIYVAGLVKLCKFHLFGDVAGVSASTGSDLAARFEHIVSLAPTQAVPKIIVAVVAGLLLSATVLPIASGYCEQCVSHGQPAKKEIRKERQRDFRARHFFSNNNEQ